jgi:hypothetical protein
MSETQYQFLRLLGQLPGRLTAEQVAWVLNCQPHDVPMLVAVHLLKPLGNAPANSVKYFATLDLLERVKDKAWLAKVTNAINERWRQHNERRKTRTASAQDSGEPDGANSSQAA